MEELPVNKISDLDRMVLELAKQKKLTASSQAELAIAKNDNADLSYKYLILQIYLKYNLNINDKLNEDGTIIIGGTNPPMEE
jgi:hypothetical protein